MSSVMSINEFSKKMIDNAEGFESYIKSHMGSDTYIGKMLTRYDGEVPFYLWIDEFEKWMENGAPSFAYSEFETEMMHNPDPFGTKVTPHNIGDF